jgi:hypothetical protein
MIRWYVMPAEVVFVGGRIVRRPEFLTTIAPTALWGWIPVKDNWGIGWVDLTLAQHQAYNAEAGVLFLTDNLENTLTAGQVAGVQTRLDNRNLPSAWIDVGDTWHQVIKRIYGFLLCLQRYYGESKQNFNIGVTVTTTINSLSQTVEDRLDVVASTFPGGALPAVNHATDTVETMLMRWSDELITRPVWVSGIEL